jgi:cholinesterase
MFLSAPPDPLPFRAAILESGQASYNGGTPKSGWAWKSLAKAVNCTGVEAKKYACMQSTPAATLKKKSQSEGIWFGPPVQDGTTWAKAPRENRINSTAESSRMARVPVLLGSTRDEGSIYTTGVTNATVWVHQHYGFSLQKAAQLLKYYPIGGHIATEADRATAVMTDSEFGCPAKFVWDDSATAAIPAWRYFFDASFANSYITAPGAYHASEIPLVFGTYPQVNATEFQTELSIAMQKAWADFAKDPTTGPGWNMSKVMVFGGDAAPGESDDERAVMATAAQAWMDDRCALYERE